MKKSRIFAGIAMSMAAIVLVAFALTKVSFTQDATEDKYPNGCVSCHVNMGDDQDYTIPTLLAKNHPKHPKVTSMKQIPEDCTKCHKEGKKFGDLGTIMHKTHYRNPDKNYFLNDLKGNCTMCHTMDTETWKSTNKQGEKNW